MSSIPPDPLRELGIRLPDLIAGFAGGVVSVFLMPQIRPLEAVGSVIVGALTANYLGQSGSDIAAKIGLPIHPSGAGFFIGLTAMVLCQGIIAAVKQWSRRGVPPSESTSDG